MPIIGLTDKVTNVSEGLPRLGKLRKGDKKTDPKRPGKDLDYFRFTPSPEYVEVWDTWKSLYGETPDTFNNVYVVGDSVDDIFSTWLELWAANETLKIRTDGVTVVREYIENQNRYSDDPRPVTAAELAECKPIGRMDLIMPEFITAIGVVGVVTVETHSKHDIIKLHKYLSSIMLMYGKLTGVPFIFGREYKQVSAPGNTRTNNKRFMINKSLFTIDVDPEFTVKRLLPGMTDAMIAAPARPQIAAPAEPDIIANTAELNLLTGEITEVKPETRAKQTDKPRRLTDTDGTGALKVQPEDDDAIEPDAIEEVEPPVIQEYKGKLDQVRHATDVNGKPLRFIMDTGQTFNVFDSTLFKEAGYDTTGWRTGDPKQTFSVDIEVGWIINDKGHNEITKVITPAPAPEDDIKEAELAEVDTDTESESGKA